MIETPVPKKKRERKVVTPKPSAALAAPPVPNPNYNDFVITQEPAMFHDCSVGDSFNVSIHVQYKLPTDSPDPTNLNISGMLCSAVPMFGFFPPVTVTPAKGIRTAKDGIAHLSVRLNGAFDYPLYIKVGEGQSAKTSAVTFSFPKK